MRTESNLQENAGGAPGGPSAATEAHGARACPKGQDQDGADTPSHRSGRSFWTEWLKVFLGRTILRVCPSGRSAEPCEGCELRVFCKCAQEDFLRAARVERTVWAVLLACGVVAILYWLYWP